MMWGHEMRLFNINKEFLSNSSNTSNKLNAEFSTIVSEPKSHPLSNENSKEDKNLNFLGSNNNHKSHRDLLKEVTKKEFWLHFLHDEISKNESFFFEIIKELNSKFYEKHQKISEYNESSTYHTILLEFEKLKELIFELVVGFYHDLIKKLLLTFKSIMYDLYEEIRNILDEMFFAKEFCFYSILMTMINISSQERRSDFEVELYNPLNLDLNYLDFDPHFKDLFNEKIYEHSIEIFRDLRKKQTPRGKYDQIMKIKGFLMKELFEKANQMNDSKRMGIDPDQIISMFVYMMCGAKEVGIINEMIFMEELLSCHWKETNINAYFYVAFKTSIHYLLRKGRAHNKRHEKYDSNESIFKV